MRKKVVFGIVLFAVSVCFAVAQDDGDRDGLFPGEWKQNVASPTYGVAVWPVQLMDVGQESDEPVVIGGEPKPLPGMDLRIFRGVNVSRRGGFFAGGEVGALIFAIPPELYTFTAQLPAGAGEGSYDVSVDGFMGSVFALAKYGYRLDVGVSLVGISLGAEMGIGARLSRGSLSLRSENIPFDADDGSGGGPDGNYNDSGDHEYYGEIRWANQQGAFDVMLDVAGEAALRLGRNFRLFARLGGVFTPPPFESEQVGAFYAAKDSNWNADGPGTGETGGSISDPREVDALMSRYFFQFIPVIPSLRVGFTLNY